MLPLLLACAVPTEPAVNLATLPEAAWTVDLPARSMAALPGELPIADWQTGTRHADCQEWIRPHPARLHVDFSSGRAPKGIKLKRAGRLVTWSAQPQPDTWRVHKGQLILCLADEVTPERTTLLDRLGSASEQRLNLESSGLSPFAYMTDAVPDGDLQHRGLLLPAPASASVQVRVPKRGILGLELGLLAPPRGDARSDGATLHIEVEAGGDRTRVTSLAVVPGEPLRVERIKLRRWAGESVTLHFLSDPQGDPEADLLLIREPAVYTPSRKPRRVVLAFIDTLRPDHMGVYGYARDTTPYLSAWSQDARVYTQARSVAPWTLPSARAALSGRMPEHWDNTQHLGPWLRQAGFVTHAAVGNAFLSPAFGIGEGFSGYELDFLPGADPQSDRARELIRRWPDRDLAVLVHFMDPHLPYQEPPQVRGLWEPELPPELDGVPLGRDPLRKLSPRAAADPEVQAYLKARYDQNIRWVDKELGQVLDALDPERSWVAVFSDHGEEFWEHGGVEHGHSLHDELLRVPLILKGPGVDPGVDHRAANLLDLAPTLSTLLNLPTSEDMLGQDLLAPPSERVVGVGYTLYGRDAWGVLDAESKRVLHDGSAWHYPLPGDPDQVLHAQVNDAWKSDFAAAFDRELAQVWWVHGKPSDNKRMGAPLDSRLVFGEGTELQAWSAYDPIGGRSGAPEVQGAEIHLATSGARYPREWYVQTLPALAPGELSLRKGSDTRSGTFSEDAPLRGLGQPGSKLWVEPAWTLLPPGSALGEVPEELEEMLRAAGYLD
ncbi:MAG: sulfatase [Myxococcota bacterium]|nr:sulfatase [Myxococcota bacterium]